MSPPAARSQNYSRILRVTFIIFKKPNVSNRQASSIWSQRLKSIFQGYASNSYMNLSLCKFKLVIGRNPRSPKKITKPDVLNLISYCLKEACWQVVASKACSQVAKSADVELVSSSIFC
jgi:hypothetical protein